MDTRPQDQNPGHKATGSESWTQDNRIRILDTRPQDQNPGHKATVSEGRQPLLFASNSLRLCAEPAFLNNWATFSAVTTICTEMGVYITNWDSLCYNTWE
ncbi:hypothetical protein ACOMHN_004583 [Nucella lapillus]